MSRDAITHRPLATSAGPIHSRYANLMTILCQSIANPMSIKCKSIPNTTRTTGLLSIQCQFANPIPISDQSSNPSPINRHNVNRAFRHRNPSPYWQEHTNPTMQSSTNLSIESKSIYAVPILHYRSSNPSPILQSYADP